MTDFDHLDRTKPEFYKLKPTQGVFYETAMAGVFRHNPCRKCRLTVGGSVFENGMLTPDKEGNCYVSFPGKPDAFLIYTSDKPDEYADNQKYSSITIYVEDDHEHFQPLPNNCKIAEPEEGQIIGSAELHIPGNIIEKVMRVGPVIGTVTKIMFFIMQLLACVFITGLMVNGHVFIAVILFIIYGFVERENGKILAMISLILKMHKK